jgi:cytochrome c-type biogenesis protein
MEDVSLWLAFGAGVLSFFSPCVLPLVPVYLASVCGTEILESEATKGRFPILFHSLSFVIGFTIIFVGLGAAAGLAGFAVGSHSLVLKIGGGLLIAFGVFLLASLKFPWLNYEKRLAPSLGATSGYLRSMLIGAIFSLAWTPCVGPVLGGILTLAWSSETVWRGAYLLAIYPLPRYRLRLRLLPAHPPAFAPLLHLDISLQRRFAHRGGHTYPDQHLQLVLDQSVTGFSIALGL